MKRLNNLLTLLMTIGLIGLTQFNMGCANIIPPQGGPRDSLPPVLIKVSPADSNKNFKGNKINFYFDEYIDLQSIQENLIVSPLPENNPNVEFKLREMNVKLKDSLKPNTTYILEFNSVVKDFNEGNVLKKLKYVFTTGSYLDSLEIDGHLLIAETGRADSTMIVLLHTDGSDSAISKSKPAYITKPDNKGHFHFSNLPARTFYLYALKDEGGSKRYNGGAQLMAFADSAVIPSSKKMDIELAAFTAKPSSAATTFFGPTDNTGKKKPDQDKRLKIQNDLAMGQQDLLNPLTLSFEQALKVYDSTGIGLYADSTYTKITNCKISTDSSLKKIIIQTPWEEDRTYHLILNKDFATDSADKKLLKTDTLNFKTKKKLDYGSLKLKLRKLDIKLNPVLQFTQQDRVIYSVALQGSEFNSELFQPGEYQLRIVIDKNKNGKWDSGDFYNGKKQPEKVIPIEKKITIKSAWTNEFDIDIPINL